VHKKDSSLSIQNSLFVSTGNRGLRLRLAECFAHPAGYKKGFIALRLFLSGISHIYFAENTSTSFKS
jgi:hypothetical protein